MILTKIFWIKVECMLPFYYFKACSIKIALLLNNPIYRDLKGNI